VDDVSFCGVLGYDGPTDGRHSGYVISQIPSQLICTRGKVVFATRNDRLAVVSSTYVACSPPLPLVPKLGAVLGNRDLCNGVGQDNTSAVRLPFPGMVSLHSEIVITVRP
jgi:hypothetical protein